MLARRFLWIVTILVLLALAAALAYRLFALQLMRAAFVPNVAFRDDPRSAGSDYRNAGMWIARPDLPRSPALWTPKGITATATPRASIFFIHPTSYLTRSRWNAPLDDSDSRQRAELFVRSQASAFNGVGAIWAPRYRQATIGALLTDKPDAGKALDLAYRDVRAAFEEFLKEAPKDRPIILAGHSQGSYHLLRLLRERVAGTPLAGRIAAVYAIGWPISVDIDLPALGLPPCRTADQARCILDWESFAEPADPRDLIGRYEQSAAPDGERRAGSVVLCVNPVTGAQNGAADARHNLGTLVPNADLSDADLRPGLVPARCDTTGLLLIGSNPPPMPRYVLPGNNYHVFDYSLFWANIRADAARRLGHFQP